MPTRDERRAELEEERRLHREEAEAEVASAAWDCCPMKQYVRRYGWLEIIQRYVERRRQDGVDRPLRYLTIPGRNASDIGLLCRAGLIERTEEGFPEVAICDNKQAGTVAKNLGVFLGASNRFFYEAVQRDLSRCFPFDVINLDLCGAIITGYHVRDRALRGLVGIRRVFQLQRGQAFLLLLTTSTDDPSARRYLADTFRDNLDEQAFAEAYDRRYHVLDLSPFEGDFRGFVRLLLPKVIGRMARRRGYKVAEHFVARYDRETHRMLCHSFELEPVGHRLPVKKYEPRFKRRDTAWDELTEELPSRARIGAEVAYEEFIPGLVARDPMDIPSALRADPELEARLTAEARSLVRWWESSEIGDAC